MPMIEGFTPFTVIQTMATIFHERTPHNKSCEGMAAEVVVDGPQNVLDIDGLALAGELGLRHIDMAAEVAFFPFTVAAPSLALIEGASPSTAFTSWECFQVAGQDLLIDHMVSQDVHQGARVLWQQPGSQAALWQGSEGILGRSENCEGTRRTQSLHQVVCHDCSHPGAQDHDRLGQLECQQHIVDDVGYCPRVARKMRARPQAGLPTCAAAAHCT